MDGEGGRRVHDAVCMADNIIAKNTVFWSNLDIILEAIFEQ